MKHVVNQVHKFLIKKKITLAVAESCTGGLLSKLLTDLPGSSKYFILGIVAYSNRAKHKLLGIPAKLTAQKGAVSREVARNIAKQVRKIAQTDFGIGVTGIAGPTGGTSQKPVGTVFIAIDTKNKNICKKFHFMGSRSLIRKKAALKSLELLKSILKA